MVPKRFVENLTVVICSTFLASFISYLSGFYPQYSFSITEILGSFSLLLIFCYVFYEPLSNWLWIISVRLKLRKPLIGIIRQNGCPAAYTSFTPDDWQMKLSDLALKIRFIQVSEISSKYAAIINPYGEEYPEEEMLTLKTFERIKRYIFNGGIFLCAGGLAFFYGYDFKTGRDVPLADELVLYMPHPVIPNAFTPQHVYPPIYSLNDTLLKRNFGVVTTWRDTERNPCFQHGSDRKFVGDIANIGGVSEILQFRAVREPMKRCIPFLRVTPQNWKGDVYALWAFHMEKGVLFFAALI
jgi:hypothetical protein